MSSAGTDGKDRRPAESRRLCLKGMVACAKTWMPVENLCECIEQKVRPGQTSQRR